jgi:DNA-binding NarL/FixJ family response regulator
MGREGQGGFVAVVGDVPLLCESVAAVLSTASVQARVIDPGLPGYVPLAADAVVCVVRHAPTLEDMRALVERAWPGTPSLLLASSIPRGNLARGRWSACVELGTPVDSLINAVERVLLGERACGVPAGGRRDSGGGRDMEFLTRREREILRLLGAGQSVGRIADQLRIADNTVRTHIANVRSKLGVHTRLDAVLVASGQTYRSVPSWAP